MAIMVPDKSANGNKESGETKRIARYVCLRITCPMHMHSSLVDVGELRPKPWFRHHEGLEAAS